MSTPTQTIRITHSWCPTCQGGMHGKARCGTARPVGSWPAGMLTQACSVCRELHWVACERCGSDAR
jgi:hypothetical protein